MRTNSWILTVLVPMVFCNCSTSGQTSNKTDASAAGDTSASDVVLVIEAGESGTPDVLLVDDGNNGQETSLVEGGYDTSVPDVQPMCSDATPPAASIAPGICVAPTDNECDGNSDPVDMQGHVLHPNGAYGNGYDDDCDGVVDEGCSCDPDHAAGTTEECYLMPSSWVDDSSGMPVGWCVQNAKGTMTCVRTGGSAEFPINQWDGNCRGAQAPSIYDVCATGDYNCDGVDMNASNANGPIDCACVTNPVQCPVDPILMNPFPPVSNISQRDSTNPLAGDPNQPFVIDGYTWINSLVASQSTGWTWQVTGGDCDNIAPHPTFALFPSSNGAWAGHIGTESKTLGPSQKEHGWVTAANDTQHALYPAFSLSGDYLVTGAFVLEGTSYTCTVKVQVRAPGVRAELCWLEEGNTGENDLDLHFGRLQGGSCSKHGWFYTCTDSNQNGDDCYYNDTNPDWGYAASGTSRCHGWGSLRSTMEACDNPRLDRDDISCTPSLANPNGGTEFCGPENINLDNPNVGDKFVAAAQCYNCAGADNVNHPHMNIYCDGVRMFSGGYDPTQTSTQYPMLNTAGDDYGGDLWTAAIVTWNGSSGDGGLMSVCNIDPVHSVHPNATNDGSTQNCVENGPRNCACSDSVDTNWIYQSSGAFPTNSTQACWH